MSQPNMTGVGQVERFFLKASWGPWTEVTREAWIEAERDAGFYPKGGGSGPATGGFSNGSVSGRIIHVSYATPDQYDWDPEFRDAVWPPQSGDEDGQR